jgi:Glutathione S-transferase, C-terminal domain
MDAVQDVYSLIAPTNREKDLSRKLEMRQALACTSLPRWLGYLERKLQANGTGFFVGSTVSVTTCMSHLVCACIHRYTALTADETVRR